MKVAESTITNIFKTRERCARIEQARAALMGLKEEIEDENPHFQILKRLGFSIVFYGPDSEYSIGFVNYLKDKIDDDYYKIVFDPVIKELKKGRGDVTDQDVQKIQKILETEVKHA